MAGVKNSTVSLNNKLKNNNLKKKSVNFRNLVFFEKKENPISLCHANQVNQSMYCIVGILVGAEKEAVEGHVLNLD